MGRLPAYIFVVRHGARLDAADKNWHLTSPTPYDPPLTYGGWLQSKALGARIGSILRQAEQELNGEVNGESRRDSSGSTKRKRRRFKVVLHSSPFLRCVQTSVAISAGIAQAPASLTAPFGSPFAAAQSPTSNPNMSPFMMPMAMADVLEVDLLSNDSSGKSIQKEKAIQKSVLRLDAFLGEWLSPEYFEMITPPPDSALMVAGAKADLLRREDLNSYQKLNESHHHAGSIGHSQLWNSPKMVPVDRSGSADSNAPSLSGGLDNIPAMASVFPNRDRAGSTASNSSQKVRFALPEVPTPVKEGYIAPTPNYAISMSAKIPDGFVTHARDACVSADYQWDSMKELGWGDGGSFGEEWTAMHRRFRSGVQHLVDWYASAENPAEIATRAVKTTGNVDTEYAIDDEEDEDTESVVIIVSHGAGCNALIGAITHQPALMDVGMASLTMAVRKPEKVKEWSGLAPVMAGADADDEASSPASTKGTTPIYQSYDLKIFANTEHLRPTTGSITALSRVPSNPSPSSSLNPGSRGRVASTNTNSYTPVMMNSFTYSSDPSVLPGSRSTSANASLGSMRRAANASSYSLPRSPGINTSGIAAATGTPGFSASGLSSSPSVGLWSPATSSNLTRSEEVDEDGDDDMFPDFDNKKKFAAMQWTEKAREPAPPPPKARERREDDFPGVVLKAPIRMNPIQRPASEDNEKDQADIGQLSLSPTGLWGSAGALGEAERPDRDLSTSKQRLAVNEPA